MCETMKMKYVLPWKPKGVRDARAVGYLLWKAANRKWNQPKIKKCVTVNKADRSWRSEDCFDGRPGDAEFGVCLAGSVLL